jgi:hypothetical protein
LKNVNAINFKNVLFSSDADSEQFDFAHARPAGNEQELLIRYLVPLQQRLKIKLLMTGCRGQLAGWW